MRKVANESGQALVLVLLSLAVVLTIVLFILSRSITDISISSAGSSAVSAFSAAEAGVEQALVIGGATGSTTPVGNASYKTTVTNVAQGTTGFVYPVGLNPGDAITLWLKSQDSSSDFSGNSVEICWGKAGTSNSATTTPAIEAVLFYETSAGVPSTAQIFRAAADPNSGRAATNSFSATIGASCNISGQTFPFSTTISGLTGLGSPQFMFVRMFYNTDTSHPVAFSSTDAHVFPSQGILVDSEGTAAQSTRKVEVFQGWPEIPNPFQFAVYGSTGLTK